jgi:hypothetical protein
MEEKIHTITAGRHVVYEIVENTDEISLTIREAEHPERAVTILRSMVPILIDIVSPLG